jgi:hypothetical protein
MSISQQAVKSGQRRLARRLSSSIPWVGAIIALAYVGANVKRKGLVRGTVDSVLNATPFIGAVKNVIEVVRGRDLIPPSRV